MKFIADVMLGRLAKRMRLQGLDVLYSNSLEDNDILRLSLEQDRMILTRDAGLAERPLAAQHLFIDSDRVDEQIEQVLAAFPTEMLHPLTRCSVCNETLSAISRHDARDAVPQYVYERNDRFLRCNRCGRVYWRGTHVDRMMQGKERQKRPA